MTGAISAADARGLPLAKVAVEGRTITFHSRSDQPMKAMLSEDGRSMSGDATMSGYTLPFTMTRAGEARIEAPPTGDAPLTFKRVGQ